ncbi:hypothetical protein EYF80_033309 [Liparis tanakae]|uniref:Uncharacterized protein n=1 Tax=Liparis tanakae TaxID=230148 RepID=A0A4Z2GSS5_9TELE|nr:hypothetical protein EYF80_033309 [Liparis tanakae]
MNKKEKPFPQDVSVTVREIGRYPTGLRAAVSRRLSSPAADAPDVPIRLENAEEGRAAAAAAAAALDGSRLVWGI